MSKLIVVCGLGGAGKTTFASALSKKLNIACIHKDSIKVGIFEKIKVKTPDTYKLFFHLAEEQVANGVDIIIETPCTHKENKEILKQWEKSYNVKIVCIVCEIDNDTRKQRITSRSRHWCHAEADKENLQNVHKDTFDKTNFPGKVMCITTNKDVDELVDNVVKEIKEYENTV